MSHSFWGTASYYLNTYLILFLQLIQGISVKTTSLFVWPHSAIWFKNLTFRCRVTTKYILEIDSRHSKYNIIPAISSVDKMKNVYVVKSIPQNRKKRLHPLPEYPHCFPIFWENKEKIFLIFWYSIWLKKKYQ